MCPFAASYQAEGKQGFADGVEHALHDPAAVAETGYLKTRHAIGHQYVIVEVKNDTQIENAVVQAKKDFAQQIAVASGMEYQIIKSTNADQRKFRILLS